jgi:hypothetical protein
MPWLSLNSPGRDLQFRKGKIDFNGITLQDTDARFDHPVNRISPVFMPAAQYAGV